MCATSINTVDQAFTANPSAGDLDTATAGLEIVAGANDGHVYAWHADGTPVAGWPVLLRDPAKVESVDPVTHRSPTRRRPVSAFERKIITTPTLADLDADGHLEVLGNANEQYVETPNRSGRDLLLEADRSPRSTTCPEHRTTCSTTTAPPTRTRPRRWRRPIRTTRRTWPGGRSRSRC